MLSDDGDPFIPAVAVERGEDLGVNERADGLVQLGFGC